MSKIERHLAAVRACRKCPRMVPPPVVGRAISPKVMLVGQAPGDREPVLGRPFAWTAGKTLFGWFNEALGWTEDETRNRVYIAAVCRCFPGKRPGGGDRVPAPDEIERCAEWMRREFELLQPDLVLPVGKLAIGRFFEVVPPLVEIIGLSFRVNYAGREVDCIPLPHPSGASPWHRVEPGRTLLRRAFELLQRHPALGGGRGPG